MKLANRLLSGSCVVTMSTAMLATPALAQDQMAAGNSAQLEEVVVTAQRRGENNQTVPIAVSTISGAQAAKLGLNDPQTIAQIVPGVTLNRSAASAVPFIRGVGTPSSTIGNEPSVATFIDDVYVTNGAASFFEFNNIQQIEVLKGPQGTLFGRNATGGVLHVHTRNPSHEPAIDMTATYGNYDSYGAQFYATGGLTENVSANIAIYGSDQNKGWGRNLVTGNEVMKGWGAGGRLKILFEPTDATSFLVNANAEKRRHGQGIGGRVLPGHFGRGGYSPDAAGAGFYDITSSVDNFYTNDYRSLSGKLTQDLGAATLVSITAYSRIRSIADYDIDANPPPFFRAMINQQGKALTQELQLQSPVDSPVSWLLGGFFLSDKSRFNTLYVGQAFGAAGSAQVHSGQDTTSYSGFAQATGEILPATKLTLGIRYTSDRRKYIATTFFGPTAVPTPGAQRTFSNLSGRFSLDHQVNDDLMVYAAYNRGFKSGIYNLGGQALGSPVPSAPAEPEDLNAYSAGFKSEWLDKRLRLNVEAYYYDYKNIQVASLLIGSQVITNAGAAKIKGLDFELTAVPIQNLTIRAAVGLTDGHYSSFPGGPKNFPLAPSPAVDLDGCVATYPTGTAPLVTIPCDLSGNDTVFTPKLSSNLSISYRLMAGAMPVDLTGSWSHKTTYYFETDNNPGVKQPTTDIFNASIQFNSPDERFGVRLWSNNLTKEKYFTYITQSGTSGTKYSTSPPRTYGVTVLASF